MERERKQEEETEAERRGKKEGTGWEEGREREAGGENRETENRETEGRHNTLATQARILASVCCSKPVISRIACTEMLRHRCGCLRAYISYLCAKFTANKRASVHARACLYAR